MPGIGKNEQNGLLPPRKRTITQIQSIDTI